MRRAALAAILVWVLAVPAHAQSPSPAASPAADPAAAQLTSLLNKSPGKIWAVTDDDPGAPPADAPVIGVFGELGAGSLSDAANTAKAFVTSYGKVLGFPDGPPLGGNMKVFRDHSDDAGRFIAYCPTEGEKTFFLSGMVVFVFKPNGNLVAVVGRYLDMGTPLAAGFTPAEAIVKAREEIKKKFPEERDSVTGDGEVAQYLCEFELQNQPPATARLYLVTLKLGSPPIPKRVVLLAHGAGNALLTEDARAFNNSAHIFDVDPTGGFGATATRDLDDLVYPGFFPYWKINGQHFKVDPRLVPGLNRAEAWTGWFNDEAISPTYPNPALCEEMVYYHCQESRKKALAWGATKDLAKHDPMYFNHWQKAKCDQYPEGDKRKECECFKTSNGWFDPSDSTLNFASDNRRLYAKHTAYDATFICHEYGHFVHKLLSEHWMLGFRRPGQMFEAKAIAEAFGDLFACSATDQAKWGKWVANSVQMCVDGGGDKDLTRDLERVKKLSDVIRSSDEHELALAFSTGIWKLRTDSTLGKDELMKTLIAGMRLCPLPCRFRNAALAFMAADQMLAGTPHTQKIFDMFKSQEILGHVRTSAAP